MNGIVGGQRGSERWFEAFGHRNPIHLEGTLEVANYAIVVFGRVTRLLATVQRKG